jgi:alpha-L-fucosidase
VGQWLKRCGEFLPNSDRSPFSWVNWGHVSVRGNTVYLHVFNSVGSTLCYADLSNRVNSVRLVDGNRPLRFEQRQDRLFIHDLPAQPDPIATVIAIETEGKPARQTPQTSFWIPGLDP